MNSDAMKSLAIKVAVMILTAIATQLHVSGGAADISALATDLVDAGFLLYGVYRTYGMKIVPHAALAIQTEGAVAGDVIKGSKINVSGKVVGALLLACLLSALLAPVAFAADVAIKASPLFPAGYPSTRCGMYYGLGTGGSSGQVEDAAVGTRIVQGELDAILGYSCPFGTAGFWFVEGSVGINNVNGTVNGLALSGPLVIMQRAGAGSPLNALFNPFGNSLALPSVPLLPAGVTAGAATPYFFAGLVEQDIATQLGLGAHSHQWLVAPLLGIGLLTRLNGNTSVVDTWAGWQMNSQSFCPGGGQACGKLGNAVRVGVSFKY